MARLPTALLLLVLAAALDAKAHRKRREGEDDSPIRVDKDTFVVRENHKLMISCVYNADDMESMEDLKWLTSSSHAIDGETSSSVFTIGLHEKHTHRKKKTLHFTEIKKRDAGEYTCQAKNNKDEVFNKVVTVHVLDRIDWNSNETRVGGLVGEPLTIDCGIRGNSDDIQVRITDKSGMPLKDEMFTIASTDVSVSSLTKEYNGFVVNCVALQVLDDLDTTSSEQRSVHIDAWFTPEFESDIINRHTVLHRTVSLPCNVSDSNPPVHHFNFFRNDVLLKDEKKYEIIMDVLENAAVLKVRNVEEDDLGEYQCEVNNGRAKATQTISLHEANPPDEVKVTLEKVEKHGFTWKIIADVGDQIPARTIQIRYIRKETLDKARDDSSEGEVDLAPVWKAHSKWNEYNIHSNNTYHVGGLRADTEYTLQFRAESEAGFGPHIEIEGSTNQEANTALASSTTSPLRFALSLLFLVIGRLLP